MAKNSQLFTQQLIYWHQHVNDRILPWKQESDPYKIWLSEVILQQTRAEQGKTYYISFIHHYPDIHKLAAAPIDEVYKLWQGLGYYNRCANMLKAAHIISRERSGVFPDTYEHILDLPGVGPYTAAAIASFAFGLPYAVLDGNVYRVLARYFGIREPIDTGAGKKMIADLAAKMLDMSNPAGYNQAIMDLGATVCMPKNPKCDLCPVQSGCYAFHHSEPRLYPVKVKKIVVAERHFHYILIRKGEEIYMECRQNDDIWKQLYQPYLIEKEHAKTLQTEELPENLQEYAITYLESFKQRLTHRVIHSHWYLTEVTKDFKMPRGNGSFYSPKKIRKLALPKSIFSIMSKKNYF